MKRSAPPTGTEAESPAAPPDRARQTHATGAAETTSPAPAPPPLSPEDEAVVAGQLGRRPRDVTGIPVRCRFGFPVVIETAPILSDGTPNPTLFYLVCPALDVGVSRLESKKGVRAFKAACTEDAALRQTIEQVAALYRARREALARGREDRARLEAGIGGPAGPEVATCLHSHAAALLAVRSGWLPADPALVEAVGEVWERFYPDLEEPWCHDRRCARWTEAERKAVIDVGTISVRLFVADVTAATPQTTRFDDVTRETEITRLGEGLDGGRQLLPAAKARTAAVVGRFVGRARFLGAKRILLTATSAGRDAADGARFIEGLGRAHDIQTRILSGSEEATLAYAGVSLGVSGDPVLLDVGGGSTEIVQKAEDGTIDSVSLDLGANRATGTWIHHDPPTQEELASIHTHARELFEPLQSRFSSRTTPATLVGVAGTIATLACLDGGLERYSKALVHQYRLRRGAVERLLARFARMTLEERTTLPCMQPGRAAVIVAGTAIVLTAMETLGYEELIVSEHDLLDGLMLKGFDLSAGD